MAALDCNQTHSFITLQQNNFLENAQDGFSPASNVFDRLPNEVIQNYLAPNLTPNEALTMRLVNRRFAILFGDGHVWRIYYHIHGLKLPENNFVMTHELALSSQAKQFNFWRSLKEEMDRRRSREKSREEKLNYLRLVDPFDFELPNHSFRSFFITILAIQEFSLLHEYALQILREHFQVPAEVSIKEIMCRIAKMELDVDENARKLATRYIAKYAMEPEVQQTLVSIVTSSYLPLPETEDLEALEAVVPYLSEITLQVAKFVALHGSSASIKIALNTQLIEKNPQILEILIDRLDGKSEFYKIFHNFLHHEIIVKQLVQALHSVEYNVITKSELILALEPIVDQEFVQQALCEQLRLQSWRNNTKSTIMNVLSKTRLVDCIKERYRHQIPVLQELIDADEIINDANCDILNRRQLLLNALLSENTFARAKAAIALTPLVPLDPAIASAFLERLQAKEKGEVGIAIISALSTIAHRKEIREIIIREALALPEFTVTAVQVLRPFAHEPEVCEAFIVLLKKNPHPQWYELFHILAPQLDKQNVLDLFLKMAKDVDDVSLRCQIIDKLASVVNNPKVRRALKKIYKKSDYDVRAACIRALCIGLANPLISPTKLLTKCLDGISWEISEAAMQALQSWLSQPMGENIVLRQKSGINP